MAIGFLPLDRYALDMAKEQVVGDDEAAKLLQPKPGRGPYKL
jgi:hypothetical protein